MFTRMKGWSLVRSAMRKASASQWSGKKRFYLETEETSSPSTFPHPGPAFSCQKEEKGEICFFPQQDWTSLCVWFAFLRISWFIPCCLKSLLLSCQSECYSKVECSGPFLPSAFHRVNQEPMERPFPSAPSSKDEARAHPYWSSNIPFAWLGWCHMLLLVQVCSHTDAGAQINHPTSTACTNFP